MNTTQDTEAGVGGGAVEPRKGEQPTPEGIRAELLAVNTRALKAYQRLLDVSCLLFSGNSLASERDYRAFAAGVRFSPWEKSRLTFERAKFESERWLLRSMLGDGLRVAGDLTEACRSAAAWLTALREDGVPTEELRKRATADRAKFLRMPLAKRSEYLEKTHGISTKLAPCVQSLADVTACLVARGGMVTKADCNTPEGLLLRLATITMRATAAGQEAGAAVSPGTDLRVTEGRKLFAVGQVVEFSKEEHLTAILTFSLYVSTLVQSVLQSYFPREAAGSVAGTDGGETVS